MFFINVQVGLVDCSLIDGVWLGFVDHFTTIIYEICK